MSLIPTAPSDRLRLDYRIGFSELRRRRFKRNGCAAILLAVGLVVTWNCNRWADSVLHSCRSLYWQHQWMNQEAVGDQAVFSERDDFIARLESGLSYREAAGGPTGKLSAIRLKWPFGQTPGCAIRVSPSPGKSVNADEDAVLFLHERCLPSGESRILLVEVSGYKCDSTTFKMGRLILLRFSVVQPGSLTRPAQQVNAGMWMFPNQDDWQSPFEFFPGQPDPDDPSHFRVNYVSGGRWGVLDGFLEEGENLRLVATPTN